MSEPPADPNQPEPVGPAVPRRVVSDWEYRTSYIELFQVRIPAGLHERLREWAEQEHKPLTDLVIAVLEEAVRRRPLESPEDPIAHSEVQRSSRGDTIGKSQPP